MVGILLAFKFQLETSFSFAGLLFIVILHILLERFNLLNVVKEKILFLGIFFLGLLLVGNNGEVKESAKITSESLVVTVTEISNDQKLWRKAICQSTLKVDSTNVSRYDEKIVLFIRSKSIQVGDELLIHSRLSPIRNDNNPGGFDAELYWWSKGISRMGFLTEDDYKILGSESGAWFFSTLNRLRSYFSSVLSRYLSGDELALASALILGDKELLSSELKMEFSDAGAMHVLAVSGLHVGIVLYLILFILGKFSRFISKRKALIVALSVIWVYAGVTGFSPSVLRATIMFSVLSVGQLMLKNSNNFNLLFFSAFLLLMWKPLMIFDIGFQLSYLAMLGIFILHPIISMMFYFRFKWLNWIWQGTSVGISAQLFTVPLTLYYFHQFPNYFALTNIGVMVLAGVLLGLGLLLFLVHAIPLAGLGVGATLSFGLLILIYFIQMIGQIPGAVAMGFTISSELVVLTYLIIGILVLFHRYKVIRVVSVIMLTLVLLFVQFERYSNMTEKELVIFNYKKPVIALKNRSEIHCFIDPQLMNDKQMDRMISSYVRTKPGHIIKHEIPNGKGKVMIGKDTLFLKRETDFIELSYHAIHTRIRLGQVLVPDNKSNCIDMPYLKSEEGNRNLRDGAVVIKL